MNRVFTHLVTRVLATPNLSNVVFLGIRTKVRSLLSVPMFRKDFFGFPLKGSLQKNKHSFVAKHTLIPGTWKTNTLISRDPWSSSEKSPFVFGGFQVPSYIYIFFLWGNILILKANKTIHQSSPRLCCVPCAATKELSSFRCLDDLTGTSTRGEKGKMPGSNKDTSRMPIDPLKSLQTSPFDWRFQKNFIHFRMCEHVKQETCIYKLFCLIDILSSLYIPKLSCLTWLGVSCTGKKYLIGVRQFLAITILVLVGFPFSFHTVCDMIMPILVGYHLLSGYQNP